MKNNRTFLEKLLDGAEVEWKTLDEIFHLKNGYTPSKGVKEYWENGSIPWFRMEDIRENGRILNTALQKVSESAVKGGKLFPANSIIIATSATIGEHALITIPFLANQRFTVLSLKPEYIDKFNIYFLYHYCFTLDDWCQKNTTMSSFASVDMNGFRRFPIPIPPLPIQTKIVKILDALTALTSELTSELILRRKQYEYYREKLLSFDSLERLNEGGGKKKLIDVCINIFSGKNKERNDSGLYPIYGSTGIIGKTNKKEFSNEQILVARVGANAGYVHIAQGEYDVSDNTLIIQHNKNIDLKFLYHTLVNMKLNQYAKGAGQPLITAGQLKLMEINVPPLEEQQRIVLILDKFETLTNSITEGLPLAIEQSQKRYEYYRELLLNF
ncbi:restriction endonuclease subunit S [Aggregatibacter aphrophilus]|uniref:Type I restriction enzyme specificity protein MPN_089 n=1 Tax=Aggregatibacter aphrophilus ATCC 33389 TaxID=985008 RepID=A0A3S4PTK3_AGGAP|nr:restriction endonuclease subunit S [Aggregatibacter aphrophilus]OBY55230.1 restriction endonuclease subunit S [Aggregatibacter aphrophilus]VEF43495.1 Type I restriction enzyme specificity protein MPN_089 [Aggregatibacter aphrophilus ATCC 33389]